MGDKRSMELERNASLESQEGVEPIPPRDARPWVYLALLFLWFLWGLLESMTMADTSSPSPLLLGILNSYLIALWCSTDARKRGQPLFLSWYWFLFFFWPVSVPAYFIRSRGVRGLGWLGLATLGLVVLSFIGSALGAILQGS